jgi:hypothetical protein
MPEHRITMDRYYAEWNLGVAAWTNYRYQPHCGCGWVGDKTKHHELAMRQAERHAGGELVQKTTWR